MNTLIISGTYADKGIQPATVIAEVLCGVGRDENEICAVKEVDDILRGYRKPGKVENGRYYIAMMMNFCGKRSGVGYVVPSENGINEEGFECMIADLKNSDLNVYVKFVHHQENGTIQEEVQVAFGEHLELFDEVVVVTSLKDSILGGGA